MSKEIGRGLFYSDMGAERSIAIGMSRCVRLLHLPELFHTYSGPGMLALRHVVGLPNTCTGAMREHSSPGSKSPVSDHS